MRRQPLRVFAATTILCAAAIVNTAAAELPRVRAADECAASLLDLARLQSPTVRRLEAQLEPGNLVAYVACVWRAAGQPDAHLRWVSSTPQYRYVLLTIGLDLSLARRVELLGHELRHANEVADATWVSSERDLLALYSNIGRRTSRQATFETEDARAIELQVRHEVGGGAPGRPENLLNGRPR